MKETRVSTLPMSMCEVPSGGFKLKGNLLTYEHVRGALCSAGDVGAGSYHMSGLSPPENTNACIFNNLTSSYPFPASINQPPPLSRISENIAPGEMLGKG